MVLLICRNTGSDPNGNITLPWPPIKTPVSFEEKTDQVTGIDFLLKDLWPNVIKLLNLKDLLQFGTSCKRYRNMILEHLITIQNKFLSTHTYLRSFGSYEGSSYVQVPNYLFSIHKSEHITINKEEKVEDIGTIHSSLPI